MSLKYVVLLTMTIACSDCAFQNETFHKEPTFADQMCPHEQVDFQAVTKSAVSCVRKCTEKASCRSLVYLPENKTCFGLRSDFPFGVSSSLPGAIFYQSDTPLTTTTSTTSTTTTTTTTPPTTITTTPLTTTAPTTTPPTTTLTTTTPTTTTTTSTTTTQTTTTTVPVCPAIGDYFSVGSYSIAMCSQLVNKAQAESFCAITGRLIEIRSEQMYLAISDYLNNMPQAMQDIYLDIWMAGEYDGNDYRFPDGSLLPITDENDYDTAGAQCIRLREYASYEYDDKTCDLLFSYMCEIV